MASLLRVLIQQGARRRIQRRRRRPGHDHEHRWILLQTPRQLGRLQVDRHQGRETAIATGRQSQRQQAEGAGAFGSEKEDVAFVLTDVRDKDPIITIKAIAFDPHTDPMTARSFRLNRQLDQFLDPGTHRNRKGLHKGMLRIRAIDTNLYIPGAIITQQKLKRIRLIGKDPAR